MPNQVRHDVLKSCVPLRNFAYFAVQKLNLRALKVNGEAREAPLEGWLEGWLRSRRGVVVLPMSLGCGDATHSKGLKIDASTLLSMTF
jgi:hypothetical protein